MTGKPAAIKGSMTEHVQALSSGGSPDVHVNGQPLWRSNIDSFSCVAHGIETVSTSGSESVFVNGHRAIRTGDFLVGAGLFNRVVTGSRNVNIGTPGLELATPSSLSAFCKAYCSLKKDWPKLTAKERKDRLQALVRDTFSGFGAPEPAVKETAPKGAAASFSPSNWQLEVPPGTFDSADPPDGASIIHECRHGEQAFAPMREAAGRDQQDDSSPPADRAKKLSEESGVPLFVSAQAAQNPVPSDTAYGRWARTMGEENMTSEGRKRENDVIRAYYAAANKYGDSPQADEAYEAYRRLPNGQDAYDIEEAGNCGGCK